MRTKCDIYVVILCTFLKLFLLLFILQSFPFSNCHNCSTSIVYYLNHPTYLLFGDFENNLTQNMLLSKAIQTFIKNSRRFPLILLICYHFFFYIMHAYTRIIRHALWQTFVWMPMGRTSYKL